MRNQSKNKRGRIRPKINGRYIKSAKKPESRLGSWPQVAVLRMGRKPGRGLDHVPHDEDISKKSEMQQIFKKKHSLFEKA